MPSQGLNSSKNKRARKGNEHKIESGLWWSGEKGYINLSEVDNEYLLKIAVYWQEKGRPQLDAKMKRVNAQIVKMPRSLERINIIRKNQRRVRVIDMYDTMIQQEIKKRNIQI